MKKFNHANRNKITNNIGINSNINFNIFWIMTFEEEMKYRVDNGYMSEDGTPLKCECGCTDFKQINQYYGEGWIEEYQLECKNEYCFKIVGHWAYGNWQL